MVMSAANDSYSADKLVLRIFIILRDEVMLLWLALFTLRFVVNITSRGLRAYRASNSERTCQHAQSSTHRVRVCKKKERKESRQKVGCQAGKAVKRCARVKAALHVLLDFRKGTSAWGDRAEQSDLRGRISFGVSKVKKAPSYLRRTRFFGLMTILLRWRIPRNEV